MKSFSRLIMLVAATVSVFLLAAGYLFFTGFGAHMLNQTATKQAETMAQVTFASMYQIMSKGWTRAQMMDFADVTATSVANTPTRIYFYRAEPVSRQFGAVKNPALDEDLRIALQSGRSRLVEGDGSLTHHMPLVAQDNCLQCHTQAKRGDVLGAISVEVRYGKTMRESSLHMFLVLLLLAPAPFIAALMVAIHLEHRFEDFNAGLDAVAADLKADKPADLGRVPVRYREFAEVRERIGRLLG